MPSSASQRRTEMDRATLVDMQWGRDASPPFVPLWRRGAIRTCAIILLTFLAVAVFVATGYLWALAELGML